MLDGWVRRQIAPLLDTLGHPIARSGVSADTVTIAACVLGLLSALAIFQNCFALGLALLLLSRLGDGLDGAVAKVNGKTDLGGYLDIVLDFVFYGAFPLAFVFADPAANAVAGAILIFSFYVNGSSFLAFAILAEKHKMETSARGAKSVYFTTGLAEGTETIAAFCAFCLFPGWFSAIAYVFAAMCFLTAISRILLAVRTFG